MSFGQQGCFDGGGPPMAVVTGGAQVGLRGAQVGMEGAQVELEDSQVELEDSQVELEGAQVELECAQVELEGAQIELGGAQIELGGAQVELGDPQVELGDPQIWVGGPPGWPVPNGLLALPALATSGGTTIRVLLGLFRAAMAYWVGSTCERDKIRRAIIWAFTCLIWAVVNSCCLVGGTPGGAPPEEPTGAPGPRG